MSLENTIQGGIYIVKAGDTLGKIASQFGVTVTALASANGIANINQIKTGQTLRLPSRSDSQTLRVTPATATTTNPALGVTPWNELLSTGASEYIRIRDANAERKLATERGVSRSVITQESVVGVQSQSATTGETIKWVFIAAVVALAAGLLKTSSTTPRRRAAITT